jgi:hypothetical protein
VTVALPALDGVNDTEHDATPAVPVAARVHGEVTNDPATPVTAKETEPVGVPAPTPLVTVAAHDDATPTVVDAGEQATTVEDCATTVNTDTFWAPESAVASRPPLGLNATETGSAAVANGEPET